jgi:AcrR family transcriptional regulator
MLIAATQRSLPEGLERIMSAAEACFGEAGYLGASMAEIAGSAGVSKSLLHYHFISKEAIFLAVQDEAFEAILREVRVATREGKNPMVRMHLGLTRIYDELARNPAKARLLLEVHTGHNEGQKVRLLRFEGQVRGHFVAALKHSFGEIWEEGVIELEGVADLLLMLFRGLLVELSGSRSEEAGLRTRVAFEHGLRLFERSLTQGMEERE